MWKKLHKGKCTYGGSDRHMGGQALRAEECRDLTYVVNNHSDFCMENRE